MDTDGVTRVEDKGRGGGVAGEGGLKSSRGGGGRGGCEDLKLYPTQYRVKVPIKRSLLHENDMSYFQ